MSMQWRRLRTGVAHTGTAGAPPSADGQVVAEAGCRGGWSCCGVRWRRRDSDSGDRRHWSRKEEGATVRIGDGKLGFHGYLYWMGNSYRAIYRADKNRVVPQADTMGRSSGPGTIDLSCRAALGTINRVSSRARTMLFRVVPRAANLEYYTWRIS
jgi:hypothetical protein